LDIFLCVFQSPEGRTENSPGLQPWERHPQRNRPEKAILGFAWQNGYGAFSGSESNVEAVTAYISAQAEHHRKFSHQEELHELLKRQRVAFDGRYLWE
jgi:hypothetical protein